MDDSFDLSAMDEGQKNQCLHCSYSTTNKSNFNKHVRRMHGYPHHDASDKKYSHLCDTCGRKFTSKFGLSLHIKSKHKLEFKHICPVCKKGFNQSVQFRFHIASHGNIGLDKCNICNVEFKSQGSLKRHKDTFHISKNKFICKICTSAFSHKYKLDEHVNGKHEEPRYKCDCGKVYGWRSSLKVHKKSCKYLIQE